MYQWKRQEMDLFLGGGVGGYQILMYALMP